jgi:DNA-binding transcriptional LysR family regulator
MRFTLRQIGVFVAVARHESVSRAAAELALSQSATSTALAELERQYDTQLFDRFGKTLHLNELGQALLPQAVELIERAAAIESVLEGRAGYGKLRIGATLTIGNYLATLIVADFLKRHPESTLQLSVHNTATIIDQLARHELDLGLIEGSCRHPDLVVEPWVADELVVFCAPGHPLAGQGRRRWLNWPNRHGSFANPDRGRARPSTRRCAISISPCRSGWNWSIPKRSSAPSSSVSVSAAFLAWPCARPSGAAAWWPSRHPNSTCAGTFHFLWHRRKFQTAGLREFIALCRTMTAGIERSDQIEWSFIP